LSNIFDKYVFSIGGYDFNHNKSVSRYEISKDIWEEMPDLNEAREKASACSFGGNIYVIGG
jgi:hypothetical protein